MPGVPDHAVAQLRRWADGRIPTEHRDEIRIEVGVRGRSVTIFECRPPWHENLTEWSRMPIAQIRYAEDERAFTLHWADRNSRWHRYDDVEPTASLDRMLHEIDDDPTCIFWG